MNILMITANPDKRREYTERFQMYGVHRALEFMDEFGTYRVFRVASGGNRVNAANISSGSGHTPIPAPASDSSTPSTRS